jgi:hypothetical protein
MKTLFLTIVAPVLLVTLGFGQTPAPTSTDQADIKGCLGGSDGNYTVAEDGTTQTFKVTSSTVDLKPHVGHDIDVTGQKTMASGSAPADNSVAVTAVSMISEQCTPATTSVAPASSAPVVADSTPAAPTSAPAVADTTPAATTTTTPVAVDPAPAAAASTPVAADPAPVAVASTPAVADPTPTAAASAPAQTVTAPDDSNQLPNTATSLPLVGLLGLGMLGLGLWTRKSRTN